MFTYTGMRGDSHFKNKSCFWSMHAGWSTSVPKLCIAQEEWRKHHVLDSSGQAQTNLDWSSAALPGTAYMRLEHWRSKYLLAPLPFFHLTVCIRQTQVITEEMIWPVKFLWTEKFVLIQRVSFCWASPGSIWFLTEAPHMRSCVVLWSFLGTAIYT